MHVSKDQTNELGAWTVKPHNADEDRFLALLLSALASQCPGPPPERIVPEAVLERIAGTSNPHLALQVVTRLNLGDDSQANLAQLYGWCKNTDGLSSLQQLIDELVEAKVIRPRYTVKDPHEGHGIKTFDTRAEIPRELDDWEGDAFQVTDEDIETIYVRNTSLFEGTEA